MTHAFMRALGDPIPLDIVEHTSAHIVAVPGFGHLILDPTKPETALLTRGPGTERVVDVSTVDGRFEIEMLHKADRLTVVIVPT